MNLNQEIISLSLLTICVVFITGKQLSQLRHFKTAQAFIVTHSVVQILFSTSLWSFLRYDLSLLHFEQCFKALLGLNFSLYLAMISLIVIQDNSAGKIKTLWRIPILGLLAGTYFELKYVIYIAMGNLLLFFIIPFKQKKKFRYLYVKLSPFLALLPGLYFLQIENILYLNLFILFTVYYAQELVKFINVNSMFRRIQD